MNIQSVIEELEKDIYYFTNLDFPNIASKFKRDLAAIKEMQETLNSKETK